MSQLAVILLVMGREIRQRLRSKGFAVTTIALALAVIASGVLYRVLAGSDEPDSFDVAVVGEAPMGFADNVVATAPSAGIDVTVEPASPDEARMMLDNGAVDVVVDAAEGARVSNEETDQRLALVIDGSWSAAQSHQAAVDAGLDEDELTAVLSPPPLTVTVLDPESEDNAVALLVGSVTAILLFISINAFGGMVLTGVVEEKTTGVIEVLLGHVKAHQLLTGKVLGIGTAAMVQFAAALAAAVVALRISDVEVPGGVWLSIPSALLWFIVGFVLYSTLFALAGSFVSRQEDAQGAAAPISVLFTAAYLTVFFIGVAPESTAARILSVLPPFAPLLMPLRIASDAASVAEILLAAVLLVASTVGMLRLAGSVYSRSMLHRGARLKWSEALRRSSP